MLRNLWILIVPLWGNEGPKPGGYLTGQRPHVVSCTHCNCRLALVVAYRKTEISQYHEVIYADVTRHLIDNATNTLAGGLGGPDGVVACTARALQNLPLTPIEDLARGALESLP